MLSYMKHAAPGEAPPPEVLAQSFMGLRLDGGLSESLGVGPADAIAPLVGSYGLRVAGRGATLATSFRDATYMPVPIAIDEESAALAVNQNSDEEWVDRKARGVGRRKAGRRDIRGGTGGAESSDDEAAAPARADADDDGGVFASDF